MLVLVCGIFLAVISSHREMGKADVREIKIKKSGSPLLGTRLHPEEPPP